jgi:O-antigen/teichoic acid export membrane protein
MAESRTAKVLILSSGQALTALVGILSTAILTRLLTKADFGSYRQAMLAYAFAAPFVILGFDRTLYAFLPGETKRPRGLLVENLILLTIAGGLLSLFISLGGDRLLANRFNNPALASLILLMLLYPLLMLPASAISACLMSRNKTEQLAIFNILSRLCLFLLVITPCYFLPKASVAILGHVTAAVIVTAIAVYLMFRACPGPTWKPTWNGMKRQVDFAIPLGLSSIIGTTGIMLDQMLVSLRCTPEIFAVYSVGAMEIPLIGIVTGSITSVVIVDYVCFYREGNLQAIVNLIHKAMVKSAILILPIMAFLFCIAPELIRLLFGMSYEWSAVPFRIYLLQLPIRTITFGAILQSTMNSKYILMSSILYLTANAIFGWTLISVCGAAGAALGALLAEYFVEVPFLTLVLTKILKTKTINLFPWFDMGRLLMIAGLPLVIVIILKLIVTLSDLSWIILALFIHIPVIIIGFKMSNIITLDEIKNIIRSLQANNTH